MRKAAFSMEKTNYIKVKDFAATVGQTQQNIYKQISKGYLKGYYKKEGKTTFIDESAKDLPLYKNSTNNSPLIQQMANGETNYIESKKEDEAARKTESLTTGLTTELIGELRGRIEDLQKELNKAQSKIEEREQQIKEKDDYIKELTAKMMEQSNNLSTMAQKMTGLIENSQVLIAREQEKRGLFSGLRKLLGKPKE